MLSTTVEAFVFPFNYLITIGVAFVFVFASNYCCGSCFCFQLFLWLLFLLSTIVVALVFAFNYCCGSLFLLSTIVVNSAFFSTIVSVFFQLLVLFFGNYWGPQSYQGSSVTKQKIHSSVPFLGAGVNLSFVYQFQAAQKC